MGRGPLPLRRLRRHGQGHRPEWPRRRAGGRDRQRQITHHEIAGGTPAFPATGGTAGPIEPVDDPTNPADVQDRTSYAYTYTYDTTRPHTPSKVGPVTHAYDANGNLMGTENTAVSGRRRQYVWDEENRLACNQDTATATVTQDPGGCAEATVGYT
ncbi:hypothetical protein [Streptomyces sp. SKN60]|uniref:hypothetical protein n=1 Tax=Streptomyces sp. SKN60 TaxID=2855506 RepID=UPI0035AC0FAB